MNKTQRLKGAAALAAAMIVTAATAGAVLGQDDCDDEECLAEQSISALVEALTAGDTARSEEALSELFTDMRPLSDPGEMGELFADVDPGALLTENVTLNFVAEMLEAQGMSSEQVLAMYEQMDLVGGGGGGAGKVNAPGDAGDLLTENVTLNFVTEMLKAQGMSSEQVEQILAMYEQMDLVGGGGGGAGKVNAPGDPGDFLTENVTLNFVAEMLEAQGMSSEQVEQVLAMSGAFGTLTDEEGKAVVINHEEQYDPADPAEPSLPRFEEPLTVLEAAALQAFADGDIDKPTLDALMEVLVQE